MPRPKQPKKTPTKQMKAALEDAVEEAVPQEPVAARLPRQAVPTDDFEDGDLYEPYAPEPGNVPLAKGETQETAPQPGGWTGVPSPKQPEKEPEEVEQPPKQPAQIQGTYSKKVEVVEVGEQTLNEPEMPLESSGPLFGDVTADHLSKWLTLAVDAIKWLAKQNRRLQTKDKDILADRVAKLEKIKAQIP